MSNFQSTIGEDAIKHMVALQLSLIKSSTVCRSNPVILRYFLLLLIMSVASANFAWCSIWRSALFFLLEGHLKRIYSGGSTTTPKSCTIERLLPKERIHMILRNIPKKKGKQSSLFDKPLYTGWYYSGERRTVIPWLTAAYLIDYGVWGWENTHYWSFWLCKCFKFNGLKTFGWVLLRVGCG